MGVGVEQPQRRKQRRDELGRALAQRRRGSLVSLLNAGAGRLGALRAAARVAGNWRQRLQPESGCGVLTAGGRQGRRAWRAN